MTSLDFQQALTNGRKLVILDEIVLDVSKFIDQHPGGRFVLSHNIGRDISKFFHGGYSLEDNMGASPASGYAHSTFARMIVNDLAIARYQPKTIAAATECVVRQDLCENVNATTKTIVFEATGEVASVPNWKNFFRDTDFLAKHFLVRNLTEGDSIARHYTICNAMRPDVYSAYINALKCESDETYKSFDSTILVPSDSNQMTFCIKNYEQPKGLSMKVHNGTARFEVKGPMGHGLQPKSAGHHIAFAAGTGVLCFVDLVAYIAQLCIVDSRSSMRSLNDEDEDNSFAIE